MLWENENVYLYVELRRFAGGVYLEHSLGAVPAVMTLLMGFASNQARDNKGCCCGFEMLYVQARLCRTAFNEDVITNDFSMEASWKQKQFCCRVNTHLAYFSSVRSLCLFTWLLSASCPGCGPGGGWLWQVPRVGGLCPFVPLLHTPCV